jgi:hypothetical protein
MNALDKLNKLGEIKSFIKLQDLSDNQKYKVLKMKKIQTKFGDAIVCVLEKNELILPNRFEKIVIDEYAEEIENGL